MIELSAGSKTLLYAGLSSSVYEAVLDILGDTGVLLPVGDPLLSKLGATTFTSVRRSASGVAATFTWSEAPTDFDTPPAFQGLIPTVSLNGTDEEADTPDVAYWSFGADGTGGNEPTLSFGVWAKISEATDGCLLSKFNSDDSFREYIFRTGDDDSLELALYDESVAGNPSIKINTDAAISEGVWHFLVATYDGSAAPSGMVLYVDGSAPAQTATDDVAYVAMENLGSEFRLGHIVASGGVPSSFLDGVIAGGPLGPFVTTKELSAAEVSRLYQMGARLLGVV